MKDNKFYIVKEYTEESGRVMIVPGYAYNSENGELFEEEGSSVIFQDSVNGANRIFIDLKIEFEGLYVYKWDAQSNYIGWDTLYVGTEPISSFKVDYEVPEGVTYIAFYIDGTSISQAQAVNEKFGYVVHPHYKQIKKAYKKESGEMFFRESLSSSLKFFGYDYELIKNADVNEMLYMYLFQNDNLYATASFNKTDCKFDHFKKSAEPKLTYYDRYTKVLDAYENTYDLIKLKPTLTPVTLTKRGVVQIYVQGQKSLSNYAGGTYWETEVDEPVDDETKLANKYYFAKGPIYREVDLINFFQPPYSDSYNIEAIYTVNPSSNTWPGVCEYKIDGRVYYHNCSIVFVLKKNANTRQETGDKDSAKLKNPHVSDMYEDSDGWWYYYHNAYEIQIRDENDTVIYSSNSWYGVDNEGFKMIHEMNAYKMNANPDLTFPVVEPSTFRLGNHIIEHQVWGRIICDVDSIPDGQGGTIDTYNLPYDDFATPRRNYKKCIGIVGFDEPTSVIQIFTNSNSSYEPSSYGVRDDGKYFIPPYDPGQYFYPLSRNDWANTSLWVRLGIANYMQPFENFCAKHYKEYTVHDAIHIADAIKALLTKIDPTITHEKTTAYSSFLYGKTGATADALGGMNLYITQKTNILKGEYDQAAQKAEIKLKQITEMLRDCFRCYWFIDDQNRFRIEHVSYFMNGYSYSAPAVQFDLTQKKDKFNKKPVLYSQREIEYDKADLISRYEFSFSDDVTKAMGGDLWVDVKNNFVPQNKKEEINIDGFTTDIDYMLFLPDEFSSDGFALIMADDNKKVPITMATIIDEKQDRNVEIFTQNWYASFNQLVQHYVKDLSGDNIFCNNLPYLYAQDIKKCVKHQIKFASDDIDINKLITTYEGNGYIEEMSTDIDTGITEIELRYSPY